MCITDRMLDENIMSLDINHDVDRQGVHRALAGLFAGICSFIERLGECCDDPPSGGVGKGLPVTAAIGGVMTRL